MQNKKMNKKMITLAIMATIATCVMGSSATQAGTTGIFGGANVAALQGLPAAWSAKQSAAPSTSSGSSAPSAVRAAAAAAQRSVAAGAWSSGSGQPATSALTTQAYSYPTGSSVPTTSATSDPYFNQSSYSPQPGEAARRAADPLYNQPGAIGNTGGDPNLFGGYNNTVEHIMNASNLSDSQKQAYLDQVNHYNARMDLDAILLGHPGQTPYAKNVDAPVDAAIDAGLIPGSSSANTADYAKFAANLQKYYPLENMTPPDGKYVPSGSSAQQDLKDARGADTKSGYFQAHAGSGPWNGNLVDIYESTLNQNQITVENAKLNAIQPQTASSAPTANEFVPQITPVSTGGSGSTGYQPWNGGQPISRSLN